MNERENLAHDEVLRGLCSNLLAARLRDWNLQRRIEQKLGRDVDGLAGFMDGICSGLDEEVPPAAVDELVKFLSQG